MSHLYKHLRIHQVFGANTDVGKTIITTALVRASAINRNRVFYLKPVSTGAPQDADDEHIKRHAGPQKHLVDAHCLFRYGDPVSPHLAVKMASETPGGLKVSVPSDETFVGSVAEHIRKRARVASGPGHMYVETAGGVHSPTLSGTTQLDTYRPLFLPTILIGDSRLGGISSTISSFESLLLRGYIIDSILLFRDEYYRNFEYLTQYFAERGTHVTALDPPPPRLDSAENVANTEKYYSDLVPDTLKGDIFTALEHLDECHARRIEELDSMPRRALDAIWWPFVQHGLVKTEKDVSVIDSAWSDFFSIYDASSEQTSPSQPKSLLQPQLDGSASWWTQAVGHAHPTLALAAANAAGRYGHVMFPQATHLPALKLAERLLQGPGNGWASRVFFSDNGSTGMEVALKMALRSFIVSSGLKLSSAEKKNLGVVGLRGSYHGDTIGAMDACEEGVYTCEWHEAKGYWFEPPTVSIRQGRVAVSLPPALSSLTSDQRTVEGFETLSHVYDVEQRLESPLAKHYRQYLDKYMRALQADDTRKLAALVLEPIVMGAGGMIFVDPLFQRIMVDVVRDPALFPTPLRAGPLLGVNPDISVNAKILTGGVLPLAVTLTSDRIFSAFKSESKVDALLHGHSYTAHAVGCQVANATLDLVDGLVESNLWVGAIGKWAPEGALATRVWSFWDPEFITSISCLDVIDEAMTLGTVLAIKFKDNDAGYASHSAQTLLQSLRLPLDNGSASAAPGGAPFGVHYRTLGNVAYFMSSLNTPRATIEALEDRLWRLVSGVRRS
ncbi:onanonoxo-7-onima-8-eninoihtemlysoneda [Suillus subaureus]|uniref:Onanonoxo-7-onima-8-eninoihtemlysoneda n=1 Tax=Suillus subaureus TaxID=48587 RepID=A0A9P7JG92_9AGAM|nr:onanonoxo-7-onima-8-eninoihtemlysoneda [Suillus subaureus]KAG1821199.1 onanonoxo-7-onima-8-eninoihtemlysoneda [Suillus subaureus]